MKHQSLSEEPFAQQVMGPCSTPALPGVDDVVGPRALVRVRHLARGDGLELLRRHPRPRQHPRALHPSPGSPPYAEFEASVQIVRPFRLFWPIIVQYIVLS